MLAVRRGELLAHAAEDAGLAVTDCSPFSEADLRAAWRLRGTIRSRCIDIVHAHTGHAVAISALATLGTAVSLVVSRRVDFPLRRNVGTRWKYGRAAVIVAVSEAVARVLEGCGIAHSKIRVVPDGVDTQRCVEPASRAVLKTLGVTAAPLVVQVAQLVGHKDPVNFVRALSRVRERLPAVQALLVGEGPLRMDVEREIETLGLQTTVRLTGYRTDADALLAAADVACLSSREEGMGSVLLDALTFGVPIAATRAGGIPEVVEDGVSGLLAPTSDPLALGDAIVRLLTDPVLHARVAADARARAGQFSVERMTDRTLAVYESVMRGATPTSRTAAAKAANSALVT